MRQVVIVQSFDGHPIGSVVELSDSAAESALIQRRAVLLERGAAPAKAEEAAKPEETMPPKKGGRKPKKG